MAKTNCYVVRGVIIPAEDDIRKIIDQLQADMAKNLHLAQAFGVNPEKVLGELGLNGDLQREILTDARIQTSEGCDITCICTTCCLTSLFALGRVAVPCEVKKGELVPDVAAVREVVKVLNVNLQKDKEYSIRFEREPEIVLGELGFNMDIQREILTEAGIATREGCDITCICTTCCITDLIIF